MGCTGAAAGRERATATPVRTEGSVRRTAAEVSALKRSHDSGLQISTPLSVKPIKLSVSMFFFLLFFFLLFKSSVGAIDHKTKSNTQIREVCLSDVFGLFIETPA